MRLTRVVLATYLLAGSSTGAARGVPFVTKRTKNDVLVTQRSASAVTVTSMIPRGGASMIPKNQDHKVLSPYLSSPKTTNKSKADVSARGGGKLIPAITRKNIGWAISLVLSFTYLFLLLSNGSSSSSCSYSQDGFCVTNLSTNSAGMKVCPADSNSHLWAWQVDAVFTVLVVALGLMTKADQSTIGGLIAAVLVHGLLHNFFAKNNCALPPTSGSALLFANVAYGGFTYLISYLAIKTVNAPLSLNLIASALGALVTVWLSQPDKPYGISPIFMFTQILCSVVFFFNTKKNTQLMGDLFVLPCLTSILELTFCCGDGKGAGFFNKIGGHVWYDLFLHISLLATYFPGKNDDE